VIAAAQPANCSIGERESFGATVQRVVDGDTLVIYRGIRNTKTNTPIRVRLIGINTPERKNKQFPAQPYYRSARISLQRILRNNQNKIKIISRQKDRHGRLLAHVFTKSGDNVQYHLLQQGLAFNLAWPPDLQYQDCYRQAETAARTANLKIWKHRYYRPVAAKDLSKMTLPPPKMNRNFRQIKAKITTIKQSPKSIWINIASKAITIRIAREDFKYFEPQLQQLLGQNVILTGYIIRNRSRQPSNTLFFMRIRHPDQIRKDEDIN